MSASQQLLATQLAEVRAQSSALLQQKDARIAALQAQLADAQRQLQQAQLSAEAAGAAAASAGSAKAQQAAANAPGMRPASPAAVVPSQQGCSRPGSAVQPVSCCSPSGGQRRQQQQQRAWVGSGTACITQQHYRADLALAGALLEHSSSNISRCRSPNGGAAAAGRGSRPCSAQGSSGAACSPGSMEQLKRQVEQQVELKLRQRAAALLTPVGAAAAAAAAAGTDSDYSAAATSASAADAAVLAQYACTLQEQLEG